MIEKEAAQKLKEIVESKEINESIENKMAENLRQECNEQLMKVKPILDDAKNNLNQIKEKDLIEIRSYKKPPAPVLIIMQMILVILKRKIMFSDLSGQHLSI